VIERLGDGDRARTCGEHTEDALDDCCFLGIDRPLTTNKLPTLVSAPHDVVAVAPPACRLPSLYASTLPAMGLLRQVLEEQGIHCALQADMQFGDFALGQGDDPDPRELHPLEQSGDILLIARQTVQGLRDYNIEFGLGRRLAESLVVRTKARGATNCGVAKHLHQGSPLAGDQLSAQPDLVVQRCVRLVLGGVSRIDDGSLHHGFQSVAAFRHRMIEHSPRTVRRIAGPEKLTCGLSGEMPDQDGHGVLKSS